MPAKTATTTKTTKRAAPKRAVSLRGVYDVGFRSVKAVPQGYEAGDKLESWSSALLLLPPGTNLEKLQRRSYVRSAIEIVSSPSRRIRTQVFATGTLPSGDRNYTEAAIHGKPRSGLIHALADIVRDEAGLKAADGKVSLVLTHHNPTDEVKAEYASFVGTYKVKNWEGNIFTISVNSILVVPETVTAYYYAIDSGFVAEDERWVFIDFGGKTMTGTICQYGVEEEGLRFQLEAGGAVEVAQMIEAHPQFQAEFRANGCSENGRTRAEIMDAIERGDYLLYGKVNFRPSFDYAIDLWKQKCGSEIMSRFAQEASSISGYAFVGGHSVFYEELAQISTQNGVPCMVLNNARHANALGGASPRVKLNHA